MHKNAASPTLGFAAVLRAIRDQWKQEAPIRRATNPLPVCAWCYEPALQGGRYGGYCLGHAEAIVTPNALQRR